MENQDETMPPGLMREVLVFLFLFGIGNAVKSFFYQDGRFTSEDCIGASMTISILIYMHWFKDKKKYYKFLYNGRRLLSDFFLIFSGAVLIAFGIYLANGLEPSIVEMINDTNSLLELFLNLGGLSLGFAFYILCYSLITMGFYTISLPVLRFLSIKYLDKQTD